MIRCLKCGKNNFDGNKFCKECGYPLSETKMYCPNCFINYPIGAKFCTSCGTKLVNKTTFENKPSEDEDTSKSRDAFTPAEIRKKFADINSKFINEGKIASVEEIMDRAGVKYEIIVKNRWYKIIGNYEGRDNVQLNDSNNIFTPAEIRVKYNSTNQMFISRGKIVSVEEIMDYEGVRYHIIEKNNLYQIFD